MSRKFNTLESALSHIEDPHKPSAETQAYLDKLRKRPAIKDQVCLLTLPSYNEREQNEDSIPITDDDFVHDFQANIPTQPCDSSDLKTAHLASVGDDAAFLAKLRAISTTNRESVERYVDILYYAGPLSNDATIIPTRDHRYVQGKHFVKIESEICDAHFLAIDEQIKAGKTTWSKFISEAIASKING